MWVSNYVRIWNLILAAANLLQLSMPVNVAKNLFNIRVNLSQLEHGNQDLIKEVWMHVVNGHFFFCGNSAVVHGNEEGLDQSDMSSQFSNPFI